MLRIVYLILAIASGIAQAKTLQCDVVGTGKITAQVVDTENGPTLKNLSIVWSNGPSTILNEGPDGISASDEEYGGIVNGQMLVYSVEVRVQSVTRGLTNETNLIKIPASILLHGGRSSLDFEQVIPDLGHIRMNGGCTVTN